MSFGVLMYLPSEHIEECKSTEQNVADVPSGDLISRDEAIAYIDRVTNSGLGKHKSLEYIRKYISALPSADRPTLKQTDTMIIADALRYLIKDTERHEIDRTRAEELREQILQYGASMCSSAERQTVIRSKTLMPTKDFKEWAKRIRKVNPNAVVIPCDAEVVSADRPQVNSAEWVAQKEREFEELHRPDYSYEADMVRRLKDALSADRPKGEGIVENHEIVCSVCGQNNLETNFCPNCGADMRPEK